jgi:hypothetical protein
MRASFLALQRMCRACIARLGGPACSAESRSQGVARCRLCALVASLELQSTSGSLALSRDESSPHQQNPQAPKQRRTDEQLLRIDWSRPCISYGHAVVSSEEFAAPVSGQDVVKTDSRRETSPDGPPQPNTETDPAVLAAAVGSVTSIHSSGCILADEKLTSQTGPGPATRR